MPSFADAVSPIVARHVAHQVQVALAQLGADRERALAELEPRQRAAMVDRLVRNLHLSVTEAPALERELLRATEAEPSGTYAWPLGSATAFIELRSGVRYLGTWVGLGWHELSRLQAVVGNLARWVQSSGEGTLRAVVSGRGVHFELTLKRSGYDAKLLRSSPFVTALDDLTPGVVARDEGELVCVEFDLAVR